MTPRNRKTGKGFARASQILSGQVRKAGETRGFAVSRLLTHWPEIAGDAIAEISRPVEVSHTRQGFGATLSLLTTGANAPILEMQKDALRERVNAVYGYNAISRIRITQTHASGFAEGQASFAHRKTEPAAAAPDPLIKQSAARAAAPITDEGLRHALETLGENVLMKSKRQKGPSE
jgi:hypothetical protein